MKKKKRDIYHEKKIKNFFLDAVGWKPYCSRLGRRARGAWLGAGALGVGAGALSWALGAG